MWLAALSYIKDEREEKKNQAPMEVVEVRREMKREKKNDLE